MIIYMFKVICVTQMSAADNFFAQLEKICAAGIDGVILREKTLSEDEYGALAERVISICGKYGVSLSLHSFANAAKRLCFKNIHLSFSDFSKGLGCGFDTVGVSVHSLEEAVYAQRQGAAYITAGHIFPTDCKKDLPPRGIEFLKEICEAVQIPVYAIGGIAPENVQLVKGAGAAGVCVMSGFMKADDPMTLIGDLRVREDELRG